jgi:hypothetical protein
MFRYGMSWRTGPGRRSWVSMPLWVMFPIWLAFAVLWLAVAIVWGVLWLLANGIYWLSRAIWAPHNRAVDREPELGTGPPLNRDNHEVI